MKRAEESEGKLLVYGYDGKVYFGKNLNKEKDYLCRLDNYEQRIRKAIKFTKKNLKINDIFDEDRRDEIKTELLGNFKLQYKSKKNDDDFDSVNLDKIHKTIEIGTRNGFYCTFSVEKDAIMEKSGVNSCNEFVSTSDETVSSVFFFLREKFIRRFFSYSQS